MKLLSHKRTRALVAHMRKSASDGAQAWNIWQETHNCPAMLYLPMGELFNGSVVGFVWAWKMKNKIGYLLSTEADKIKGLKRQGLEGLIQIETDLAVALMAYDAVPEYRARVKA